MDSSGGVWDKK
nr:ribosomal protein L22 [Agapetes malipoensis]UAX04313.1 ribosomal protein L22 [Agapetes malipoensis]